MFPFLATLVYISPSPWISDAHLVIPHSSSQILPFLCLHLLVLVLKNMFTKIVGCSHVVTCDSSQHVCSSVQSVGRGKKKRSWPCAMSVSLFLCARLPCVLFGGKTPCNKNLHINELSVRLSFVAFHNVLIRKLIMI